MNSEPTTPTAPVDAVVMRPGPGWKHVAGPVWDHVSGVRLHTSGLVRLQDGSTVSANQWPQSKSADRAVRIAGSRRRGLMVWALWVLNHRCEFDEVYYGHQCNVCGLFFAHGCAPWDAVPEYA